MNAQLAHSLGHEFPELERLLDGQPRRKRHQAAAIDACRDIARAAQAPGNAVRHAADRRVARRPAEGRVVQIERVDVDGEHRDAAVLALRDCPVALQQLLQVRQREQSGQAVVANGDRRSADARRSANRATDADRCAAGRPRRDDARHSASPGRRHRAAAAASSRSKTACRPCGNCAAARGRTRPASWPRAAGGGRPVRGRRPAAAAGCGPSNSAAA